MTQTLGINDQNDIYLGPDGNIVLLSGLQAVLEACETASRAQLGEMVLTDQLGIPNFQAVWTGVANLPLWQSYLLNTLQNVPGVLQVTNLQVTRNNGVLKYTATISTQYGTGVING